MHLVWADRIRHEDLTRYTHIYLPELVQRNRTGVARTNRDAVIIAEHGCGKTLAYVVPLLIRAAALQGARHEQPDRWEETAWQDWRQRPPDGVILVPTNEVAQQAEFWESHFQLFCSKK